MKAIQADSDILKHIQELFRHIQTPVYPDIFRPLFSEPETYPEPWHIHDPGTIQNAGIFTT